MAAEAEKDGVERRRDVLGEAMEYARAHDAGLRPLGRLDPADPFVYVSVGGGELGDLVLSAAKRSLGGMAGGVMTVALDRYRGFPAADVADASEVLAISDGDQLEAAISRYVPDPSSRGHAVLLEVEGADARRTFEMGIKGGYNVVSTPYAPLICMDRLASKILLDMLGIPRVEWRYAADADGVRRAIEEVGTPAIVKPVVTSSGHGTSVVSSPDEAELAYGYAMEHARGRGREVVVERYLPELKGRGLEVTQLVLRYMGDGGVRTAALPPIGHWRPGAVYHESWMPAGLERAQDQEAAEYAVRIADALGGLGLYAVEEFVVDGRVYVSEFANRPHDTGMVSRWVLREDEGALQLRSTMGLPIVEGQLEPIRDGYCAAHVVLAPEDVGEGAAVESWDPAAVYSFIGRMGYDGDVWFFGKPSAYPGRRMGLAAACDADLAAARRAAAEIAARAAAGIGYGGGGRGAGV